MTDLNKNQMYQLRDGKPNQMVAGIYCWVLSDSTSVFLTSVCANESCTSCTRNSLQDNLEEGY